MIGLSFASVPLYDLFCRVTGFGGTTQIAENSPDKILNKLIKVRFDTNVSSNLDFNFKSIDNFSDIKVGEVNKIKFRVTNEGNKSENVVSTFNTSPPTAGIHFKKISSDLVCCNGSKSTPESITKIKRNFLGWTDFIKLLKLGIEI